MEVGKNRPTTVELEDIVPAVFNLFIDWLYSQKISIPDEVNINVGEKAIDCIQGNEYHMLAIMLYALANRFLVRDLTRSMNRLLVADYAVKATRPSLDIIIFAFGNLRSSDTILDLLVDFHCCAWHPWLRDYEEEAKLEKELPHDFLLRVMHAHACSNEAARLQTPGDLVPCDYHEHDTLAEWKACEYKRPKGVM
ncbi:hypothetical protein BU26DRAFT_17616 [Trematosphaeria pertusa]|uniref:BTB domain-containing protein n=1 Tax=Trematosphaeria pertusa TaxID=390896 RepID=A0A6A6J448_9PLEO|nr:uncharacterized protein BU26DRAFT_17616 [Trematosphaeria pertusa]KAF2256253.1 hypothetical protein BU26DRAFT_17616 [Trematosphaeria pertusa]